MSKRKEYVERIRQEAERCMANNIAIRSVRDDVEVIEFKPSDSKAVGYNIKTTFDHKNLVCSVNSPFGMAEFAGNLDEGAISPWFFGTRFNYGNVHYLAEKCEYGEHRLFDIDEGVLEEDIDQAIYENSPDEDDQDEKFKVLCAEVKKILVEADRNEDDTFDLWDSDRDKVEELFTDFWEIEDNLGVVPSRAVIFWITAWKMSYKQLVEKGVLN